MPEIIHRIVKHGGLCDVYINSQLILHNIPEQDARDLVNACIQYGEKLIHNLDGRKEYINLPAPDQFTILED